MFVVYRINTSSCPECGGTIRFGLQGIASGLGPQLLQCRKCGTIVRTSFTEWPDMRIVQKIWYVIASAAYAAFGSFFGGMGLGIIAGALFPAAGDAVFPFSVAAWLIVILAIQALRVVRSNQRTRNVLPILSGHEWRSRLEVNPQVPLLAIWGSQMVIGMILSSVLGRT